MNKDLKIIICNESVSTSVLTDIFSYGILTALLFVNYNFLGDSTLVLLLIIVCFFVKLSVYANRKIKKMTPAEALEYLQANTPCSGTEKPAR